jgi:hypothetical protein
MIAPPKGGKNTIATFSPFTFYQKNRYLSIPFLFLDTFFRFYIQNAHNGYRVLRAPIVKRKSE